MLKVVLAIEAASAIVVVEAAVAVVELHEEVPEEAVEHLEVVGAVEPKGG